MNRVVKTLVLTGVFVACCLVFASSPSAAERPNILLIVADDLGWNDVGYHGSKCHTPNIDQLASSGVELDQHYVQPVCSPTRAALLSGRYPSRFGPHVIKPTQLRAFPSGTVTLAFALQSSGYKTYLAGKWHLGSRMEWGPRHYGFDHSYGTLTGAADPWTHQYRTGPYANTWHRDEVFVEEKGNVTELLAQQVIQWIREQEKPWFVYVPFTAVHIPVDTPPEYKQPHADKTYYDDPIMDESFKRYAAYVSQLDAKIGEFAKVLDETGQRKDTLIVFFSDNGALHKGINLYISDVPPTPVLGDNSPLRGLKNTLYEGGIRVPALANWPGKLGPRKMKTPMHVADWMPTLTKLVGWLPQEDLHWDGQDVWPLLTGQAEAAPRTLYWAHPSGHAIRQEDWKLLVKKGNIELFNLAEDPYETTNLASQQPTRIAAMEQQLQQFQRADLAQLPEDLRGVHDGSNSKGHD